MAVAPPAMKSLASLAPPRRVVAEESVKISTLWMVASRLLKSIVSGLPAGAPRQFLSKPDVDAPAGAEIWSFVPSGWHVAADGGEVAPPVGTAGVGWAMTRPPEAAWATSRFAFTLSNQARAWNFPSGETARLGLVPFALPETGRELN